jgi:hypothetical protein
MRKSLLGLLAIAFLLGLVGCKVEETPTPTTAPTATLTPTLLPTVTLDPCAKQQIAAYIKPMTHWMNSFDDTVALASVIPIDPKSFATLSSWTPLIMDLQKSRRSFVELELPSCLLNLQQEGLDYMNSTVEYLVKFMNQSVQSVTTEELNKAISDSQALRTKYETERAQLLGEVFTLPPTAGPANETPSATVEITPTP